VPALYSVYYQLTTPKSERAVWPGTPDGGFDDLGYDDLPEENLSPAIADLEKDNGLGTAPRPQAEPEESFAEGPVLTVRQTGADQQDDPLPDENEAAPKRATGRMVT
jgi:hypothetical protein